MRGKCGGHVPLFSSFFFFFQAYKAGDFWTFGLLSGRGRDTTGELHPFLRPVSSVIEYSSKSLSPPPSSVHQTRQASWLIAIGAGLASLLVSRACGCTSLTLQISVTERKSGWARRILARLTAQSCPPLSCTPNSESTVVTCKASSTRLPLTTLPPPCCKAAVLRSVEKAMIDMPVRHTI